MTTKKNQIKLAVVDDHNLFRKGLIKLINLADTEGKYSVIFEADDAQDMMAKIRLDNLPDIILMDIDMGGADGYEAVTWINNHYPDIDILVISMFETDDAVRRMLQLGVKGYLSKDIEVEDMHMALDAISNKGLYYSKFVSGIMRQAINDPLLNVGGSDKVSSSDLPRLSEVEHEFINYACTDLTYLEIADLMHLSPKTIDGYRDSLFKKLHVRNRVSLAMYAVKNGIHKL